MSFFKKAENNPHVSLFEYRPSLYYKKFQYKIKFFSQGLRFVRTPTMSFLSYKQKVRRSVWGGTDIKFYESCFENNLKISQLIHEKKRDKEIRVRQEYDSVSFFSSDVNKLVEIKNSLNLFGEICEAKPVLETGVLYFTKPPKYKYRAVFGYPSSGNNETLRTQVKNFIETYSEYISPSYKLRHYSEGARYYHNLEGCTFDYNDERVLTIVSLGVGDFITKILELKQRPVS